MFRAIRQSVSRVRRRFQGPKVTQALFPAQRPGAQKMLLIVCNGNFDQNYPSAGPMIRIGMARGWSKTCGPVLLVGVADLPAQIPRFDSPAVLMSALDFEYLSDRVCKALRNADLFVWVGVHPSQAPRYERLILKHAVADDTRIWRKVYRKVLSAEPKFVWDSVGRCGAEWYQGWRDEGLRWVTLFPAADPYRYYPDAAPERFGAVRIAYLGGYWPEKAQAYDLYLRPWEEIFVPFGYQAWPYKHYGGRLDEEGERQVYSTAGLIH